MGMLVPDASIICKWVLGGDDEPEQDAALEILHRWLQEIDQIILPSLWIYEVGNVIGLKRPDHASSIIDLLLDYELDAAEVSSDLYELALTLMREDRTSFYDAVYHALALQQHGVFVTADKRYFNKAKGRGSIELLGA